MVQTPPQRTHIKRNTHINEPQECPIHVHITLE